MKREDDALNTDNEVKYQNGLTPKNVPFAFAADSLFTNYEWTMERLTEAETMGERYGLHPVKTYFGIDVWAQNTGSILGPPRTTFPPKDGGGTNTGSVSLQNIAQSYDGMSSSKPEMYSFGINAR